MIVKLRDCSRYRDLADAIEAEDKAKHDLEWNEREGRATQEMRDRYAKAFARTAYLYDIVKRLM